MAGATYTPDYAGVGEMLRSDWMLTEMLRRGAAVMDEAEATAPVYSGASGDAHRGRYKENFRLEGKRNGGVHGDRAAAYIWNDAPEAAVVEYGFGPTEKRPKGQRAHRTLRNALHAAAD